METNLKIAGIDRLTLLDYPEKTAATIFLAGCDMNCPFCHNSELMHATPPFADYDEITAFLEKRKDLLDGIVISGGEPSLQNIEKMLRDIKSMGYAVKLDTNGANPDRTAHFLASGLIDYIAMDIKNSPARYFETAGCSVDTDMIARSAKLITDSGIKYEFRTTVTPSLQTADDIKSICREFIPEAMRYFLQPFVMRGTVPCKTLEEPSDGYLRELLVAAREYIPTTEIRGREIEIA